MHHHTYTLPLLPRPLLQDYGRDEDAAVKALKKHGGLEEEVGSYQSVVTALQKQAESLVSGDHFDSSNITARQVQIQAC